jgi:hypothetical protein
MRAMKLLVRWSGVLAAVAVVTVGAALAGGCAVGAPPGFGDGDRWSVPLVGPLENGLLAVPVRVNGAGPFLFVIDPDAPQSSVDAALASSLELFMTRGGERADETDTLRTTTHAEVRQIEVGTLTVNQRVFTVHPAGTYWAGGRMARGLLGRDILADSLIVAIDRDRGALYLGTQGHLEPPPDAMRVSGRHWHGRFLVDAKLNRTRNVRMHVDLGAQATMLWENIMSEARLPRVRVNARLVDEIGTAREVTSGAMAAKLSLGPTEASGVMVLPFDDRRLRERDFHGAIGQNFLARYHVTLNRHEKELWLKPRSAGASELATERLRRWGPLFDKCKTPACVTIAKTGGPAPAPAPAPASVPAPAPAPVAAATQPPGADATDAPGSGPPGLTTPVSIQLSREQWTLDLSYEVMLEAIGADGQPLGAPFLRATFPTGAATVTMKAGTEPYAAAASFHVVDMSPFPKACDPAGAGLQCVWAVPLAH